MAGSIGHEVKCAGCRSYFRLDQVWQEGNAYYCRKCHGIHESAQLSRAPGVTDCPVCGKELTPYDRVIRDNGFSYCPDCYARVTGEGRETGNPDACCAKCGKSLAGEEVRASYGSSRYCFTCYEKAAPYLDVKLSRPQPVDWTDALRNGEKRTCSKCRRDLGPFDVKIIDRGVSYCEECYREAKKADGKRRFHLAEQAGMSMKPGTTSLRNPEDLVECDNCGYVVTRDRLETFPKDARGKIRCPRCDKVFAPAGKQAPEKAKPGPAKPDKMKTEDFAVTAQLFKCLGDPCRVKIVESLGEKEMCVFEFVDITGAQYSAISYHLKMLKELGIIRSYERGNFVVYSLTDKGQIVHEFIEKSRELNGDVWISRAARGKQ